MALKLITNEKNSCLLSIYETFDIVITFVRINLRVKVCLLNLTTYAIEIFIIQIFGQQSLNKIKMRIKQSLRVCL